MGKEVTAVKREALFIKQADLGKEVTAKIIDRYTFNFYVEKACKDCEYLPERHCDMCDSCAAFNGSYGLATKVKINDTSYVKMPLGDLPRLRAYLERLGITIRIRSKAPKTKIRKITFTGTLKDFQGPAVQSLIEHKRGILKSLPRTGKTVMSAAAVCEVGMKTMILASQRDWLMGFHETFVGSKTQKPLTDLDPSRIGFPRNYEEFCKFDICLVTVQKFRSEAGMNLLRRIRDLFPVVIVDECFPKGTPVQTDQGSRPIEEVVASPSEFKVLSYNHGSGAWEYRQVTSGFVQPTPKKLLRINLGGSSFVCTEDHRVWSEDKGDYVMAKDLIVGERLLQPE